MWHAHSRTMFRTPLLTALCCALAISAASPLVDEIKVTAKEKSTEVSTTKADGGDIEEGDWWNTICRPADDSPTVKSGDIDKLDTYDTHLQNITGCESLLVPTRGHYKIQDLTQLEPEQRLAVRNTTAGPGAVINIEVDGQLRYYFSFSNTWNNLKFHTWPSLDQQWVVHLPARVPGHEYLPFHFKLTQDGLWWHAGCGPQAGIQHIGTWHNNITLELVTYRIPHKLLYNCPKASPSH